MIMRIHFTDGIYKDLSNLTKDDVGGVVGHIGDGKMFGLELNNGMIMINPAQITFVEID